MMPWFFRALIGLICCGVRGLVVLACDQHVELIFTGGIGLGIAPQYACVAANDTGGVGGGCGSPTGDCGGAEWIAATGRPFGRGGIEVKPDAEIGLHENI